MEVGRVSGNEGQLEQLHPTIIILIGLLSVVGLFSRVLYYHPWHISSRLFPAFLFTES
jgi:hypothetical protein